MYPKILSQSQGSASIFSCFSLYFLQRFLRLLSRISSGVHPIFITYVLHIYYLSINSLPGRESLPIWAEAHRFVDDNMNRHSETVFLLFCQVDHFYSLHHFASFFNVLFITFSFPRWSFLWLHRPVHVNSYDVGE